jgi:hypothetical protein
LRLGEAVSDGLKSLRCQWPVARVCLVALAAKVITEDEAQRIASKIAKINFTRALESSAYGDRQ